MMRDVTKRSSGRSVRIAVHSKGLIENHTRTAEPQP
jgi:hypothetical protein